MKKYSSKMMARFLVCLMVWAGVDVSFLPVAQAGLRRSSMILYVTRGEPAPVLTQFGTALTSSLSGVRQICTPVASGASPLALSLPDTNGSTLPLTPGDELFIEAGKTYMSFDAELAMQKIDQAIYLLGRDPGLHGNLIEAWLFKAQILIEQGRSHDATLALEEAVALNLALTDLDAFSHSAQLRQHYRRAYQNFMTKTAVEEMSVTVSGGVLPVYVNGMLRGTGPALTIRFPKGRPQILRAGGSLKSRKHLTAERVVALSGRAGSDEKKPDKIGDPTLIKPAPLKALVAQVLQRAQTSAVDEVILLEVGRENGQKRITMVVVDVASARISHPLTLETDGGESGMQVMISQAENYLRTLSPEAFAEVDTLAGVTEDGRPSAVKSKHKKTDSGEKSEKRKSFFASPAGIAIIGVLVAGAGVGAAFMLGGGGGGGGSSAASTTTTVTISGPAPSVPSSISP